VRRDNLFTQAALLILGIAVLYCVSNASVLAQQPDATQFNQTFETIYAKANAECRALWADHAFDPFRDKFPLGEEKPTFSMLQNSERLRPKDRPLADLAIKTLERCRAGYAPAFAMLPPQVNVMVQGLQRRQDALIAELYSGKITFGEYNINADRMIGEFSTALSGIPQKPQTASSPDAPEKKSTAISEPVALPPARPTARNAIPKTNASHEIRFALVIGDSKYSNLPKLTNPANDARAVADLLRKMGFNTKLVIDASELDLRREVRKFANDTAKADIAFVFYAGHGAQVSGQNYVLPVDMGIPQTEADIELTGLKVDDLVNSIRAKTKVVFLDACRDNPALFKNLVKGRGSYPKGLAPAVSSNFQQTNPGGGVFIAYATDSGSVALDGTAEHSPFTQALLRNLTKPISIDDMFSLVTREVRLVTKNTQRPYKYASLENIACLTGGCSTVPSAVDIDITQQAKRSETDDLP
jgi:Caspase domain